MENVFLSCDWGTSSFRLRLIDAAAHNVLAASESNEGVASIYAAWQQSGSKTDRSGFYTAVLQKHIALLENELACSLQNTPIIVSGMASSSIGIKELPYKQLPFRAAVEDLYIEPIAGTKEFRHTIVLVSGASTKTDVMRGEETQLAGCIAGIGEVSGTFIFPGTHSKHVTVENGIITNFRTFMTGEFFHLLATNSILSKSVSAGNLLQGEHKLAFEAGVQYSLEHNLLHGSFMVRTNDLFRRFSKEQNYWYLSGLVIGAELQALLHHPEGSIMLVSQGSLATSYAKAFAVLDGEHKVAVTDADTALIKAHVSLFQRVGVLVKM